MHLHKNSEILRNTGIKSLEKNTRFINFLANKLVIYHIQISRFTRKNTMRCLAYFIFLILNWIITFTNCKCSKSKHLIRNSKRHPRFMTEEQAFLFLKRKPVCIVNIQRLNRLKQELEMDSHFNPSSLKVCGRERLFFEQIIEFLQKYYSNNKNLAESIDDFTKENESLLANSYDNSLQNRITSQRTLQIFSLITENYDTITLLLKSLPISLQELTIECYFKMKTCPHFKFPVAQFTNLQKISLAGVFESCNTVILDICKLPKLTSVALKNRDLSLDLFQLIVKYVYFLFKIPKSGDCFEQDGKEGMIFEESFEELNSLKWSNWTELTMELGMNESLSFSKKDGKYIVTRNIITPPKVIVLSEIETFHQLMITLNNFFAKFKL